MFQLDTLEEECLRIHAPNDSIANLAQSTWNWCKYLVENPVWPRDWVWTSGYSSGCYTSGWTSSSSTGKRRTQPGIGLVDLILRSRTETGRGTIFYHTTDSSSWTLLVHEVPAASISHSSAPPQTVRLDLLRERLRRDEPLLVERIRLDGHPERAHGTAALSLLERRGFALLAVDDGHSRFRVPVARP